MFGWWRARRRRKLLKQPFPPDWLGWLQTNCRHYARLNLTDQQRLRNDVRLLIAEKNWEGCRGLVVTPEMQVTIAAHAALLGLGFPELPFQRLVSILIYPETFASTATRRGPAGIVDESPELRLGEAWYQGPVILSWREVAHDCLEHAHGRNVVLHEFAHLLDMSNHETDGVPDLDGVTDERWVTVFVEAYQRHVRQTRLGRNRVIDAYGATSPAEFFAVASETFFESASALQTDHPELYAILQEYYRQDPAARAASVF